MVVNSQRAPPPNGGGGHGVERRNGTNVWRCHALVCPVSRTLLLALLARMFMHIAPTGSRCRAGACGHRVCGFREPGWCLLVSVACPTRPAPKSFSTVLCSVRARCTRVGCIRARRSRPHCAARTHARRLSCDALRCADLKRATTPSSHSPLRHQLVGAHLPAFLTLAPTRGAHTTVATPGSAPKATSQATHAPSQFDPSSNATNAHAHANATAATPATTAAAKASATAAASQLAKTRASTGGWFEPGDQFTNDVLRQAVEE